MRLSTNFKSCFELQFHVYFHIATEILACYRCGHLRANPGPSQKPALDLEP